MGTLAVFKPSRGNTWDSRKAAHLLNRAGFGGTPEEIAVLVRKGPEVGVRDLVNFESIIDTSSPPAWVANPPELPQLPPLGQAGQDANAANLRRNFGMQIQRQQRLMLRSCAAGGCSGWL